MVVHHSWHGSMICYGSVRKYSKSNKAKSSVIVAAILGQTRFSIVVVYFLMQFPFDRCAYCDSVISISCCVVLCEFSASRIPTPCLQVRENDVRRFCCFVIVSFDSHFWCVSQTHYNCVMFFENRKFSA